MDNLNHKMAIKNVTMTLNFQNNTKFLSIWDLKVSSKTKIIKYDNIFSIFQRISKALYLIKNTWLINK